jgi:UDP-N-acetylmuramoylalanine--D-glutamate ligase
MQGSRRHTVIFGLGVTGYSCLRFLHGRDRLTVLDTREEPPFIAAAKREFPEVDYLCGDIPDGAFIDADRVVVSPGIALDADELDEPRRSGIPLISDISLFCAEVQAPVIAITGTNGKSTVTALVGHLCEVAGVDAGVGGNIGDAALDLLVDDHELYVLELSSFQLERLIEETFTVAVVLNVTADHLDRYADFDAYVHTKGRVYRDCQVAVYNREDANTRPECPVGKQFSFGLSSPVGEDFGVREVDGERWFAVGDRQLAPVSVLKLKGRHNELNALAALALTHAVGIDADRVAAALGSFAGLSHRCQIVTESNGVTYIDDSKATNVGATLAALVGLGDETRRHIVLIAGGVAKGADLSPLATTVARFVKSVVLLGRDAPLLAEVLRDAVPIHHAGDMEQCVALAKTLATTGDIVLLSPACASLDMFDNFEARGRAFEAAVGRAA